MNYPFKNTKLKGLHNLLNILKTPLTVYVLDLVKNGILRLDSFLMLNNLFNKSSFDWILSDIKVLLKFKPSIENLQRIWSPEVDEILWFKKDF